MVSIKEIGGVKNKNLMELVGLSTDTKPKNSTGGVEGLKILNGSTLFEMNTGNVYMFDYDSDDWRKL